MSKKSFTAAPKPKQPTADEIEAFERGGAGHDRAAPASMPAPAPARAEAAPRAAPAAPGPVKRLSIDLPAVMHTRFKAACSATGRKMNDELQAFIDRRTAELEEEAGISRR